MACVTINRGQGIRKSLTYQVLAILNTSTPIKLTYKNLNVKRMPVHQKVFKQIATNLHQTSRIRDDLALTTAGATERYT